MLPPFPYYWSQALTKADEVLSSIKDRNIEAAREELKSLYEYIMAYLEDAQYRVSDITENVSWKKLYDVYDLALKLKYVMLSFDYLEKVSEKYLKDSINQLQGLKRSFPKVFENEL